MCIQKTFESLQQTMESFKKNTTSPSSLVLLIQVPRSHHQIHVCSLHPQKTVLCSTGHKKEIHLFDGTTKGKQVKNNCTESSLVSKTSKYSHKPTQIPHNTYGRFPKLLV